MRDDRFPEMDETSLEQRIAPLLDGAKPADAPWLRALLTERETVRTFAAVDSELFVRGRTSNHAIAVTSAARAEGRTTLALVLAVMTAALDASKRVLLVDADIDNGRLGETLGLEAHAPGLAELFAGRVSPAQAMHPTALANLSLTPVASRGARALALAPNAFEAFLDDARTRFDLIVIDTPSGGNKSVISIAKLVGHALLVVRYAGPTREQVASFLADLNRAGSEVIGCVMNRREYVVPALLYGHR